MKEDSDTTKRLAKRTLQWIIEANGGLTDNQIKVLEQLIDAGYIEADKKYPNHRLIIHN